MRFSYWRGKKDQEIDIIAESGDRLVPFEVKYRNPNATGMRQFSSMREFCLSKDIAQGYVITREIRDFGILKDGHSDLSLVKIPAPLACYWLGQSELDGGMEQE